MVEIFQLSDSEFQASLDEVLAARMDKARPSGPVTRSRGIVKRTQPPAITDVAKQSLREALFSKPPDAPNT